MRHFSLALPLLLAMLPLAAQAVDVGVVGLFPGKAVLVIDGGSPRTVSVGAKTPEGVKLLSVGDGDALVEAGGKSFRIVLGAHAYSAGASGGGSTASLNADTKGHFLTLGTVNGAVVRFMVDTGATLVSLGASDARRANIDYSKGEPGLMTTANGVAKVWRVKLDAVRVGDIVLTDIDGAVQEGEMPVVLLGMSFLNRMEMRRDGETLTLRRRY